MAHLSFHASFCVFCNIKNFISVVTNDVPMFVGWRTLDILHCDVDKIQLSTRTTHSPMGYLPFSFSTPRPSFFRLTVIYTRYVHGTIVFKVDRTHV